MENKTFEGFAPETFRFFKELEANNNRQWFETNKHTYETHILQPMRALFMALAPVMHGIDPDFDMRPQRALSRIYRDVRFSKDKTPYKPMMWMVYQLPVSREVWTDYPCYYLELRPDAYSLGLGLFGPKKKVMNNWRDAIAYQPEEFQRITQETVLGRGYHINGELYKRPLPNDLPEYFQPWMQRKGIWVEKVSHAAGDVFTPAFAARMAEDFKALEWLYRLMKEAVDE